MRIELNIDSTGYDIDGEKGIDIAMPLDFSGLQPNVHDIGKASAETRELPGMIGDVSRGGSCNWCQYHLTPHSHGTHTECAGHITTDALAVPEVFKALLIPLTLITVLPVKGSDCHDSYLPDLQPADMLITSSLLEEKLQHVPDAFCQGIAIRTLPNGPFKLSCDYQKNTPPFFSREAMEYLLSKHVAHLLVDFPSVDRMHDEGHMLIHRLFWNIPLDSRQLTPASHSERTITELIYAAPSVADGHYALNLQMPSFVADAAPSRPLLFKLTKRG